MNHTGTNNTFIGSIAGQTSTTTYLTRTGNQNTYLGYLTSANSSAYSNSTAVGTGAQITASNQVVLGTSGQSTFSRGNIYLYNLDYNQYGTVSAYPNSLTYLGAGNGTVYSRANSDGSVYVKAQSLQLSGEHLSWGGGAAVSYGSSIVIDGGRSPLAAIAHGEIIFYTANTERMKIDSNGTVMLNTISCGGLTASSLTTGKIIFTTPPIYIRVASGAQSIRDGETTLLFHNLDALSSANTGITYDGAGTFTNSNSYKITVNIAATLNLNGSLTGTGTRMIAIYAGSIKRASMAGLCPNATIAPALCASCNVSIAASGTFYVTGYQNSGGANIPVLNSTQISVLVL